MAVASRRRYSATMLRSSMAFISFRFRLKGLHPYKHPLGQPGYTVSKIIAKNPACFDRKPLNSEPKRNELRRSLHRNGTSWSVWRTERSIWNRAYKPQFRQKRKKITQPAGAATPRDSDAHKRIAVPKAFCVLREHTRPRPKNGKVCRSDIWPRRVSETCGTLRG